MAETKLKEQSMNVPVVPFSGASVTMSAVQVVSDATWEALEFDEEVYDTDSYHDNVTNNPRLTVPADGTYLVTANATFNPNSTGQRMLLVTVNGGSAGKTSPQMRVDTSTGGHLHSMSVAGTLELTATDYVEAEVYQTSTGDLNTATITTNFSIVRLA